MTGRPEGQALLGQTLADHLGQIFGGARLHAGGDFLGEEFEQKLSHVLRLLAGEPAFAAGFGKGAHAADIGLALGDRDHAARIEQIEAVAGLDALVIGRQGELGVEQRLALLLGILEMAQQHLGVGVLEIMVRNIPPRRA